MLTDVMDRLEGGYEAPADGEAQPAQVAEPKRKGISETFDEDLKEIHPWLYEGES